LSAEAFIQQSLACILGKTKVRSERRSHGLTRRTLSWAGLVCRRRFGESRVDGG